jgi:hypothetical protein
LLHIQPAAFMHLVGIVEILVGIAVLTRYTDYAAYMVMLWLWCIAANLVTQWACLDVAVRDLEISLAAFTLAILSEVRGGRQSKGRLTTLISESPASRLPD